MLRRQKQKNKLFSRPFNKRPGFQQANRGEQNVSVNKSRLKGFKCRECGGYGHIRVKYCDVLKKNNNKSYNITLRDCEENQEYLDNHNTDRDDDDSRASNIAFNAITKKFNTEVNKGSIHD
jgi:hypothetical protein